ncbi:MAG TPA: AmmeMemoRadiSam system protein B [Syntrophobacteria bacterium]|nr:AmmeMemoRadiSam system protein B [Syntrophobacteria bacterium]
MDTEQPKLRNHLMVIPIRHGKAVHVMLQDQEGLSRETVVLSPEAYFLVTLMNGSNTLVDIQAAYMRQFGQILFREHLEELIGKLDLHLFLDNERSRAHREQIAAAFRNRPRRPAFLAGSGYEADPDKLQAQLLGFFSPECGGPGDAELHRSGKRLLGLVAPHIDLRAGGPCFAHAYKALLEAAPIGTCVILGTGHEPLSRYFALTRKDFETPLGPVPVDTAFVDELCRRVPFDLFLDELAHRREHTIEFQVLFLRLLLPDVRIVPILCSFGVEEMEQNAETLSVMVRALKETMEAHERPVCLLASVDLAHIGPRYGDSFEPHPGTVHETARADQQLLEAVAAGDPDAFASILIQERNSRRVCGLPPLYTTLRVLEGRAQGEVLHYAAAEVDPYHSFVSFTAMALYERAP